MILPYFKTKVQKNRSPKIINLQGFAGKTRQNQPDYMILQDGSQGFPSYIFYMKPLTTSITRHTTDHSNVKVFKFSFLCDCCKKTWTSPSFPFVAFGNAIIENKETRELIWAWEHQKAFGKANLEANSHFYKCPECNKRVCADCFETAGKNTTGFCRRCSMEKNKTGKIVPGKLTITNFIGSSHAHVASLTENKYIFGQVTDGKTTLLLSANTSTPAEGTIRGGKITNPSITLNVFKVKGRSAEPFTEDISIPISAIPDNEMSLILYEFSTETLSGSPDGVYINTSAIDFRNGNATLNFGYQMEWLD